MSELQPLAEAFAGIGEAPDLVLVPATGHLVADGHRIVSQQPAPGVHLEAHTDANGIREVRASHREARVTHAAAIGGVDHHQLNALMARGISPAEAVDRIVLGRLR